MVSSDSDSTFLQDQVPVEPGLRRRAQDAPQPSQPFPLPFIPPPRPQTVPSRASRVGQHPQDQVGAAQNIVILLLRKVIVTC